MKMIALAIGIVVVGLAGYVYYMQAVANPAVARELREDPMGDRAKRVMLLRLPSGREIPVNYLREGEYVYAGADGRWWTELRGDGADVELLIQGEELSGKGRAIEDDPERRRDVFSRLRPNAIPFAGVLVAIELDVP